MGDKVQIIILVILLGFSAFFSGAETALTSLSDIKVRNALKNKKRGSYILHRVKSNSRRLIVTILIGNNIVNIGASAIATILATGYFGSKGVGIATGIMTFLVLIFGEITPKSIAHAHAEGISLVISPIILVLEYILYPFVVFFEIITKIIMKVLRIDKTPKLLTEEEFRSFIEIGAEEKIIKKKEKELIEGILEFKDITVKDVMTTKQQMFCLSYNLTLKKVLNTIARLPYSRIPIIKGSKDKVIGIAYTKDILKYLAKGKSDMTLGSIANPAIYIPGNMLISDVFEEFQKRHVHIGIVFDKDKRTIGLVTLEDIIEEIVGEIIDEKDLSPNTVLKIDKNTILAHGKIYVRYINDYLCVSLPEAEKTISELIISKAGKLPKRGEKFKLTPFVTVFVEEISKNKILKVRIIKKV